MSRRQPANSVDQVRGERVEDKVAITAGSVGKNIAGGSTVFHASAVAHAANAHYQAGVAGLGGGGSCVAVFSHRRLAGYGRS